MSAGRTQGLLLAALLGVLAVIVAYQMRGDAPAGPAVASGGAAAAQTADGSGGPVTDVRMDLLRREPSAFRAPLRDPFRFYEPPAPRPAVQRAPEPPPPPLPSVARGRPTPAVQTRPEISSSIRLIGIVERGDMRVAHMQDGTSNPPFTGLEGDVIEGKYRLLRVYPNAIEIAYIDGSGRMQIPLTGR